MTDTTTLDATTLVQDYLAGWNETDPTRRRDLIARTWTDDAEYVDPLAAVDGHAGIDLVIAGAQEQFPGHRFVLADGPETHHDRVRFRWHLVGQDGPVAAGLDVGVVARDGRLRSVTGFLEQP
ncbi:MAG: nuclear transport factor 2 family protein [Solirubrobacteraceae bacterium]